jgi:hypothetical protein
VNGIGWPPIHSLERTVGLFPSAAQLQIRRAALLRLRAQKTASVQLAVRAAALAATALVLQACTPWKEAMPPAGGFTVQMPGNAACHFSRGPSAFGKLPGSVCFGDAHTLRRKSFGIYTASGYELPPNQDLEACGPHDVGGDQVGRARLWVHRRGRRATDHRWRCVVSHYDGRWRRQGSVSNGSPDHRPPGGRLCTRSHRTCCRLAYRRRGEILCVLSLSRSARGLQRGSVKVMDRRETSGRD